jgi:predicted O-methyltransferase YrrM
MRLASPLRRWEVLAGVAQSIGARRFVEVGCKEGRTTGYMLANLPELEVVAVDPWAPVPNAAEDYSGWDFAAIEAEFWRNVGEHKARTTVHRVTSIEAATLVPDGSVDLVFIDAAHDFEGCYADIGLWLPKLRGGGYLTGHDYQHRFPGVHRAVAHYFNLLDVSVLPDAVWAIPVEAARANLANLEAA